MHPLSPDQFAPFTESEPIGRPVRYSVFLEFLAVDRETSQAGPIVSENTVLVRSDIIGAVWPSPDSDNVAVITLVDSGGEQIGTVEVFEPSLNVVRILDEVLNPDHGADE